MGLCVSTTTQCKGGGETLAEMENNLNTGDIVMLIDGSKSSKYLVKGCVTGGWIPASQIGFLVRDGPGEQGLTFYTTDSMSSVSLDNRSTHHSKDYTQVSSRPLAEELSSGQYRIALIRRLHKRLTPQQEALVKDFVFLNRGRVLPADEASSPSTIIMASTTSTTQAFERFTCPDFVALMLHLVGAVAPTDSDSSQEYVATDRRGRLLTSPWSLKFPKLNSLVVRIDRNSPSGVLDLTPRSSSTGGSSPHHSMALSPSTATSMAYIR